MKSPRLHRRASTTPEIRGYIRDSDKTVSALAAELGISRNTVRKWRERASVEDRPHTPLQLRTALRPGEETLALLLRQVLALPLDDLLALLRESTGCTASRSGLDRCLRRHHVARLPAGKAGREASPGVVELHWLRLRTLPTGLLLGVDRHSRWAGCAPLHTTRPANCRAALLALAAAAPFPVRNWLVAEESFDPALRWLAEEERYTLFRSTIRASAKRLAALFSDEARGVLAPLLPRLIGDAPSPSLPPALLRLLERYNQGFRPRLLGGRSPLDVVAASSAAQPASALAMNPPAAGGSIRPAAEPPGIAFPTLGATASRQRPRPISLGTLPSLVGYRIRETQLALFKDFEHEIGALNLTPSAFSMLELLSCNPGLSAARLAMLIQVEPAALAPVVDRLLALGLLQRAGPTGRRGQLLLTADGVAAHRQATALIARHEARALQGFSKREVAQLMNALERVVGNLASAK
ncbi:MarR family transcriptional regulator [Azoarcus sp. TTM-91]|uniref:MarR family transcriptional regulator n=1 Tax=Azoarcus sp. TTM-91 TaxID=2691581 RepID=UPI00145E17EC|nr:MarR family transcriptional regulator [Azoarcus sp. TTM-91]NMG36055.1 MarR family transcriptional regulator [Azoarcus sp. TTM-91]